MPLYRVSIDVYVEAENEKDAFNKGIEDLKEELELKSNVIVEDSILSAH